MYRSSSISPHDLRSGRGRKLYCVETISYIVQSMFDQNDLLKLMVARNDSMLQLLQCHSHQAQDVKELHRHGEAWYHMVSRRKEFLTTFISYFSVVLNKSRLLN